jgi:hypothetical protein
MTRLFKGALGFTDVMQEIQRDIARNLWDFFEAVRLHPPSGEYGAAGRIARMGTDKRPGAVETKSFAIGR